MKVWGTGIYQNSESDDFLRKIVIISAAAAAKKAAGKKPFDPQTSQMPKDAVPIIIKMLEDASTPAEKLAALDLACEMGSCSVIKSQRKDVLDSLSGELSPEKIMSWHNVKERRDMLDALVERCDDVLIKKRRSSAKFPKEWIPLLLSKKNT